MSIQKVLLTGGHEIGGVQSFAEGLAEGFKSIGLATEIVSPTSVFRRFSELRDNSVLKILSTAAVFAAPFAKRAICVSHECPRTNAHGFLSSKLRRQGGIAQQKDSSSSILGWVTFAGLIASYKAANFAKHARLTTVSDYTALNLQNFFDVRVDSVIRNPLREVYYEFVAPASPRRYITYVGRVIRAKNIHRVLPSLLELLDDEPELKVCIIGDGAYREELEAIFGDHPRIEFKRNSLSDAAVRDVLRKTAVFFSANGTEGLGITFLEAMSQGCPIVMAACGGGIEIALEEVGNRIQLLPLSFDSEGVKLAFRRALAAGPSVYDLSPYTAANVARRYLELGESIL